MALFEDGEFSVELDDDGFVVNPDDWDEGLARALAAADRSGPLNADHS